MHVILLVYVSIQHKWSYSNFQDPTNLEISQKIMFILKDYYKVYGPLIISGTFTFDPSDV